MSYYTTKKKINKAIEAVIRQEGTVRLPVLAIVIKREFGVGLTVVKRTVRDLEIAGVVRVDNYTAEWIGGDIHVF